MLQISGLDNNLWVVVVCIFSQHYHCYLGFLLVGFGVSSVVPIVYGMAGKSKTMSAGTALASVSTIGFLGFLIGPPVIGFIAQAISLRWSFTLIGILGFGTAILARKLKLPNSGNTNNDITSNKKIEMKTINNKPENPRPGFVAWPETRSSETQKPDHTIVHGRTRNGGYVAFPKI